MHFIQCISYTLVCWFCNEPLSITLHNPNKEGSQSSQGEMNLNKKGKTRNKYKSRGFIPYNLMTDKSMSTATKVAWEAHYRSGIPSQRKEKDSENTHYMKLTKINTKKWNRIVVTWYRGNSEMNGEAAQPPECVTEVDRQFHFGFRQWLAYSNERETRLFWNDSTKHKRRGPQGSHTVHGWGSAT